MMRIEQAGKLVVYFADGTTHVLPCGGVELGYAVGTDCLIRVTPLPPTECLHIDATRVKAIDFRAAAKAI